MNGFDFGFDFTMGAVAALITVLLLGKVIDSLIKLTTGVINTLRRQWRAREMTTSYDLANRQMIETIQPTHRWVRLLRKSITTRTPC